MRARTLLTVILLSISSGCAQTASVEVYCPEFPDMSEEERQDMLARIERGSPAYRWFERLYVLKTELDTCKELANAGD